ncbi:MAG: transketolase family protein [Patescibacteria group bacterium]|nr:transketolase family protein [Patescibacteria group bacterium]
MPEIGEKIATRKAFGEELLKLGGTHKNIVVLDADLSCSVMTNMFAKRYDGRHFNVGIAEANMVGTAAGFALRGKIAFVASFAVFATGRCYDQIRASVCYPNLNVKVMGTHSGMMVGEDGATHQMLEDLNLMRGLPNMKVFCPADAYETCQVLEAIVNDFGPAYVRLGRNGVPVIYDENYKFEIGKGDIVRNGKNVCVFAIGSTVSSALEAAEKLEANGKTCRVVNMCSIKPIDEDLIVACAEECDELFSIEDHSIIGGLGSAVSEVLTSKHPKKLHRLGMKDVFGESGKSADLYKKYKLDGDGVYEQIKELL